MHSVILISSFQLFLLQLSEMNTSEEADTLSHLSQPLPDRSVAFIRSIILAAWSIVFSVEAGLIIVANIYTIIFLIRGHFDRVRYFAVSFAFIDTMRGCTAIVIVLGLVRSSGHSCRLDYQELHLALQTFCDVFSMCFLAAISCDMYYRTFWPLTHRRTRARCYMSANFAIWIISMTLTMFFAFALGGFFQLLIADIVVWFTEIMNLTVICTTYFLIWQQIKFGEYMNHVWRIEKQNVTFAKAFSLCAIVYLVIWLPIEVLEGLFSHLTKNIDVSCNGVLFMKFLKIFCSTVSPVIYLRNLSQFNKPCSCTIIHKERSIYLPDSLPLISLRSASYLMMGFD